MGTLAPPDRSSFPDLLADRDVRYATGVRGRDGQDSRSRHRSAWDEEVPAYRPSHRGVRATRDALLGHRRGVWGV